jgi:hypothetical protein
LTANSLQRKTGTAPETTEQKNPQLLSNWDCIICGYFHGLKKMVAEKEPLTTTHWPVAIKLSVFYISFLEFDR